MSFGHFKETNEDKESNEASETIDNTERPKNQILEIPKDFDDFDSKLDANDAKESSEKQSSMEKDDSGESKRGEGKEEKTSILDKMRNIFSKKESGETDESENTDVDTDSSNESQQEQLKKSWELSPEDVKKVHEGQNKVAEKERNGEYEKPSEASGSSDDARGIEHGEDGERTRYSDAQYVATHQDAEH